MVSGAERFRQNRAAGIVDRAVHLPFDAERTDELAAIAEYLFARRYDLPHRMLGGPDDGADFTINGLRIGVVWTPRRDGQLLRRIDTVKADYYVLIVGDPPDKIVGFTDAATVRASIVDLGHGPTHAVPQDALDWDVDFLVASLRRSPK